MTDLAVNDFLANFGFALDPFESTNADDEPGLSQYFVPPPYFATVMGNPESPKSHIVLAPRGGGKTAQRRMIENRSAEHGEFLCVTYDSFDPPDNSSLKNATWSYHMNQLCRLILTGVLIRIDDDPSLADGLSKSQKQVLKFQIARFLGDLSAQQFKAAVDSIKSAGDKAKDFWDRYAGPIAAGLAILMKKMGLDGVELPSGMAEEAKQDESLRFHFAQLSEIVRTLGFSSTYILVDRVDETSLTSGDAATTLQFIEPLTYDLPTLEADGVGFKFFLWDRIEDGLRAGGARPDRVPLLPLKWSLDELSMMLERRLTSYSGGGVTSFNDLLCSDSALDLHQLVCHLSGGSPRGMIRLAQRIVAEATRISDEPGCLNVEHVWLGVRLFCDEIAEEVCGPAYLADLRKVGQVTFTISQLASNVFHIKDQAARRKIQLWGNAGVVGKIGEIPNPPNRPLHLFGVTDIRVALAIMSQEGVDLALGNIVLTCPSCGTMCVTDRAEIYCLNCNSETPIGQGESLLARCS